MSSHPDHNIVCNPTNPHKKDNRGHQDINCNPHNCDCYKRLEKKVDQLIELTNNLIDVSDKILKRVKRIDKQIPEAQGD